MSPIYNITKGPHIYSTGGNGSKHAGVELSSIEPVSRSYKNPFICNLWTIDHARSEFLWKTGITRKKLWEIIKECRRLENEG